MNRLLDQLLQQNLARASVPAPPAGFRVETPVAPAAPSVPAPPPGFTLEQPVTPGAPVAAPPRAIPAPPPGFYLEQDQSTALGDLKAGVLQAGDLLYGGDLRSGLSDYMRAENDLEFGPLSQREDQTALNMAQPLDAEIAQLEAIINSGQRREDMAEIEARYLALKARRNQVGLGAGADSTADLAGRVAAAEANRPAADAEAQARADAALPEIMAGLPGAISRRAKINEIPMNPAAAMVADADTFGEGIDAFLSDPTGAARSLGLRSLPAMAPTVAATVVGQRVLGPAGAAIAGGATGAETERRMSVVDKFLGILNENRVDATNEQAVADFIAQNPDLVRDVLRDSNTRAMAIGALDAISGGLAGRLASAAAGGSRVARVGAVAGGTGVEIAGEGAGEAAALGLTEGEIKPGDVLAEMIGAGPMSAVQATGQVLAEAVRPGQPSIPPTPPAPPAPPAADPAPVPPAPPTDAGENPVNQPTQGENPAPPPAPTRAPTWEEWGRMTDDEKKAVVNAGFMPPAPPVQPAPQPDPAPAPAPAATDPAPVPAPTAAPAPAPQPDPAPVVPPTAQPDPQPAPITPDPQPQPEPQPEPQPAPLPTNAGARPEFDPIPDRPDPKAATDAIKIAAATSTGRTVSQTFDNGQVWAGTGNAMIRTDTNANTQRAGQVFAKNASANLPEGAVQRVVNTLIEQKRKHGTQDVTWQGVATVEDAGPVVVGRLPDGTRITVRKPLYDLLRSTGGRIVALKPRPGDKPADVPIVALDKNGDVIGVTMPQRMGDENFAGRTPSGLYSSPDWARKRIKALKDDLTKAEAQIRRLQGKTDPKAVKDREAAERKAQRLRDEIADLETVAAPAEGPKGTPNFVQPKPQPAPQPDPAPASAADETFDPPLADVEGEGDFTSQLPFDAYNGDAIRNATRDERGGLAAPDPRLRAEILALLRTRVNERGQSGIAAIRTALRSLEQNLPATAKKLGVTEAELDDMWTALNQAAAYMQEFTKGLTNVLRGPRVVGSGVPAWAEKAFRDMVDATGLDVEFHFYNSNTMPSWLTAGLPLTLLNDLRSGKTLGFAAPITRRVTDANGKTTEKQLYVIASSHHQFKETGTAPDELAAQRAQFLETIAHEIGHAVQATIFDNLRAEDKLAVLMDYATWLATTPGEFRHISRSPMGFQTKMEQRQLQRDGMIRQGKFGTYAPTPSQQKYAEGFHEWFADMSARYFTSAPVAQGVVDKFFASIAAMWKRVFAKLRQQGYVPQSITEFYEKAAATAAVRAQSGQLAWDGDGDVFDPNDPDATGSVQDGDDVAIDPGQIEVFPGQDDPEGDSVEPFQPSATDADPDADVPDVDDGLDGTDADMAMDGASNRAGRGGFTPGFSDVSTTKGLSPFEQAWTDAGLTPQDGNLLPPVQQVNVLARLLERTFGIKVERSGSIRAIDAVNQMLDAYRNVRFMLHVLQLPTDALSLGGRLGLTLEGVSNRYLGAYNSLTMTIKMPGRSNSFAHEWAHALDHYLRDKIAPQGFATYLSRATRREGLNPRNSLEEAFITLMNRMFYDDAALAARIMDLEQEASAVIQKGPNAGQPTQKAIEAQQKLDRLLAGNSRLPIRPSQFRSDSQDYSPSQSGYYGSAHEMFARAFEAYVGFLMERAGANSNAFVTKGDEAYTSDADARLAMTFPKATERMMIFAAFDEIFHHIRTDAALGLTGTAASRPTDTDLYDPKVWPKMDPALRDESLLTKLKQEVTAVRNALTRFALSPRAALMSGVSSLATMTGANRDGKSPVQVAADWARFLVYSQRGFAKMLIGRQPKEAQTFLNFIMSGVMTDPGTGRDQNTTVEEVAERTSASTAARIMDLLRDNSVSLGIKNVFGALPKAENDTIRKLMFDGTSVPGATTAQKAVANGLRKIMNAAYVRAVEAGQEMGYVEDQGYLPRVVRADRVNLRPDEFRARAAQVYEIEFDNITPDMDPKDVLDLAAIVGARLNPMGGAAGIARYASAMGDYRNAVRAAKSAATKAAQTQAAANADPTNAAKQRAAQQAKKDLMAAQVAEFDARQALLDVVRPDYGKTSAEQWLRRIQTGTGLTFDSVGPDNDFASKRKLPKEAEAIMGDFYEDDVIFTVLDYVHSVAKRTAYQERFGKEGKDFDSLDAILGRAAVQASIRSNPSKYDPKTPAGRLNILRDLADPKRDNIKEMAFEEARRLGADPEALVDLRDGIERIVGSQGRRLPHLERFTTAVYVLGTIMLLPRVAITSVSEPLTFLLRTGDLKNTGRVFGTYLREAIRNAKSTKELADLAEMVGVVSTPLHDAVLLNRVADGTNYGSGGNVLLTKFFRANFLTQITNAQRRAVLNGGFYMMRDLAREWAKVSTATDAKSKARAEIIKADFRDLGLADDKFEGFMNWLASKDSLPSRADLGSPEGEQFSASVARLVDQTIQNPRRADKTAAAMSPFGRLVMGLTSFIYAFTRNVHAAIILRTQRNAQMRLAANMDSGMDPVLAAMDAGVRAFGDGFTRFVGGFTLMITGQFLAGVVRAAIFDADQWEEKEKDDEVYEWLLGLAVSRSGITGPADVLLQSVTGLRYERDLTSLGVGPQIGYMASNMQNMLNGLPRMEIGPYGIGQRNSPNTENAEHTAAKGFYRLAVAPTIAAALSMAPTPGPVSAAIRGAALQAGTSGTAANAFADSMFTKSERGK